MKVRDGRRIILDKKVIPFSPYIHLSLVPWIPDSCMWNPGSGKFLLVESGIQLTIEIWNPNSTDKECVMRFPDS